MTTQQIFGLQVLLSFVLYTLVARWYVSPRLAALPVVQGDRLVGLLTEDDLLELLAALLDERRPSTAPSSD